MVSTSGCLRQRARATFIHASGIVRIVMNARVLAIEAFVFGGG